MKIGSPILFSTERFIFNRYYTLGNPQCSPKATPVCANTLGHSGIHTSQTTDPDLTEFLRFVFPHITRLQLISSGPEPSAIAVIPLKRCLFAFYTRQDNRIQIDGRGDSDLAFLELPREGTLTITLPGGEQSSSRPGTAMLTTAQSWERMTAGYSGLTFRLPKTELIGRLSNLPEAASLSNTAAALNITNDTQTIFLNSIRSIYGLSESAPQSSEMYDDALIAAIALLITTNLHRQQHRPHGPFQTIFNRAHELIIENLTQGITVRTLAETMGVSERYLQIAFKSVAGTSPKQFILAEKLERSKTALLNDTSLTIVEVSDRYGFSSPGHFSSAFKSRFGISPRDARSRRPETDCPVLQWLGHSMHEV